MCPTRLGRDEVVADHQTVYACVSLPLSCKMIIGPYQSRILHGVGTVGISKVFERPIPLRDSKIDHSEKEQDAYVFGAMQESSVVQPAEDRHRLAMLDLITP